MDLAEEAYRRFADHPDPAIAAPIHLRASYSQGARIPRPARVRSAGAAPVRAAATLSRQSQAWRHLGLLLVFGQGPGDARRAAFTRGLEVAEAAGAPESPPISSCTSPTKPACTAGSPKVSNWRKEPGHEPTCPGTSRRWWRSRPTRAKSCSRRPLRRRSPVGLRGLQAARESGHDKGHIASLASVTRPRHCSPRPARSRPRS
jgi:hypothetical protein